MWSQRSRDAEPSDASLGGFPDECPLSRRTAQGSAPLRAAVRLEIPFLGDDEAGQAVELVAGVAVLPGDERSPPRRVSVEGGGIGESRKSLPGGGQKGQDGLTADGAC
jgi:hypothetical protein